MSRRVGSSTGLRRCLRCIGVVVVSAVAFSPAVRRGQEQMSLCVTLPPIAKRVFLVTGSTDGIGKFTAEKLAQQGAEALADERCGRECGHSRPRNDPPHP